MPSFVQNLLASATIASAGSALLMAGSAQASISCTFGTLSACSGSVQNLGFSNFVASGSASPDDVITILFSPTSGVYSISNNYTPTGSSNPLTGSGTLSFDVQAGPSVVLNTASANSDTLSQGAPPFSFRSDLTNFVGGFLVSRGDNDGPGNFTSGSTSSSVLISWAQGNALNEAYGSSLRLTTKPSSAQAVPGPLPLIGAGAAFGLSRRLRRRTLAANNS
jgi:hypothetical protein